MKRFLLLASILLTSFNLLAQDISLPEPTKKGGIPLMEALSSRKSSRNFVDKKIDNQTLSNLLWAAYGFNRDDGHRVVPSSQNHQEIDLYVAMDSGIYYYDAKNNKLVQKVKGDNRKNTGSQDFVSTAALNFLLIANLDKASNRDAACIDCGFIMQNIYLYCASEGLGAVVRASFDKSTLHNLLKLTDKQEVIISQSVGYTK